MQPRARVRPALSLFLVYLVVGPGSCQFIFNPTIPGNAIIGIPGVAEPSPNFLDQQALAISESLIMKNGGDLIKAFQEGLLLFNSSSIYIDAMAANHANTSAVSELLAAVANSDVANVTNQLGTALANLLPDRVGLDVLRYNYTQAFLPGLITAATGLSYEPCLISAGLTGAVLGDALGSPLVQTADATGIGISPRIFNTGPLGAGVIAEAISINPALLYIAQSADVNVAVGYSVMPPHISIAPTQFVQAKTPSLITIAPTQFIQAKLGESISPYGISVGFATPPGAAPAADGSVAAGLAGGGAGAARAGNAPGSAPGAAPHQAPMAAPAQAKSDAGQAPGAATSRAPNQAFMSAQARSASDAGPLEPADPPQLPLPPMPADPPDPPMPPMPQPNASHG